MEQLPEVSLTRTWWQSASDLRPAGLYLEGQTATKAHSSPCGPANALEESSL
jgi:hypothetical protein